MCGIAGIISRDKGKLTLEHLQSAVECLRHRGPQGGNTWQNHGGNAMLGHRRLAIIDLSEAAAQPMHYLNRYTIIHNGEIYNYTELRSELERSGYVFRSASDTEVIMAAFDAWQENCLQRFDGMYAFAIWDEKEQKLFAARDRMGEKPFYYAYEQGLLIFASEMKALWSLGVEKRVNSSMLYNFLTIGYTSNPRDPGECFYEHIRQLPPATFLSYTPAAGDPVIEKYWDVETRHTADLYPGKAIEQFTFLFSQSVTRRLRSDVAIGTSLSGGLDSAAVVAYCEKAANSQYSHHCFTASFEGFEKDETAHAAKVAQQFGLQHHLVHMQDEEIPQLMDRVMQQQEIPFSSGSVLAQYKVYEAARLANVTVLLDGQGADELLAGYTKYYSWYWRELYRKRQLASSGELLATKNFNALPSFGWKDKLAALFPDFITGLQEGRKTRQAYRDPALDREFAFQHKHQLYYTLPAHHDLNGILYHNSCMQGLDELLRLADRNSMAHGVEVRLPFLYHELVEFLFTLPATFKIRDGWTKWLLRKTVEQELPTEIVWRKDKVGFEPPQKQWMENKQVQEAISEGKNKLVREKILDPVVLKKNQPHTAYATGGDWRYWTASYLFGT